MDCGRAPTCARQKRCRLDLNAVGSVVLPLLRHSWLVMGDWHGVCKPITCLLSVGYDPWVPDKEEKCTGMGCCGMVKGCSVCVDGHGPS